MARASKPDVLAKSNIELSGKIWENGGAEKIGLWIFLSFFAVSKVLSTPGKANRNGGSDDTRLSHDSRKSNPA